MATFERGHDTSQLILSEGKIKIEKLIKPFDGTSKVNKLIYDKEIKYYQEDLKTIENNLPRVYGMIWNATPKDIKQ